MSGQGKRFPIHLDEARSVGLAKACVPLKNLFCSREKQFITEIILIIDKLLPVSNLASSRSAVTDLYWLFVILYAIIKA